MKPFLPIIVAALALSGCAGYADKVSEGLPSNQAPMRAIGYATVAVQPGKTAAQKQLMAIRAAKLAAMRELAEKIYGANVSGQFSAMEGRIVNDVSRSDVEGLIRSARIVRIQPVRNDVYEAELEIEIAEVMALRRYGRPAYR